MAGTTDTLGRTIPTPEDGKAKVVKIGGKIENCLNDVPLHPATTPPDKSSQGFQSGDVVTMQHHYTFENVSITFAGGTAKAAEYRAMTGKAQKIELGGEDGFVAYGNVYVSTGPVIPSNAESVPTITVTVEWLTTFDPDTGALVHPANVAGTAGTTGA